MNRQCYAKMCFYLTTTAFSVILSTGLSYATVLEFSQSGDLTVTESPAKDQGQKIQNQVNPITSNMRDLTRETAINFSGSVGVRKVGLDALSFITLFETLIQRESNFDPNAISTQGAIGLGQLMPGTAVDMGVADPYDPKSNLNGAAKYFTMLLARFGSLQLALAAYNAGPERIVEYGGIPPFKETQEYVAWILNRAGIEDLATTAENVLTDKNKLRKSSIEQPLKGEISVWEF